MREPIIMESRLDEQSWPTTEINSVIDNLHLYLSEYIPETTKYTKYAIMGPVGKLLPALQSEQFGDVSKSYAGFVANIHLQTSKKPLSQKGYENLESAIKRLIEIKRKVSQRNFQRIIRSIDYGVFFKKWEDISQRHADKTAVSEGDSS